MKNKEIEELLNKLKKCRDYDDEVLLIKQYGATLLLSYIEQLEKQAELGEHYKHLYNELKKQKDDVVEYIKEKWDYVLKDATFLDHDELVDRRRIKNILRMLGEIDVED